MKSSDLIIGKFYKAIGDCGMTKDKEVVGKLIEMGHNNQYPILECIKTKRHCLVKTNTMEILKTLDEL